MSFVFNRRWNAGIAVLLVTTLIGVEARAAVEDTAPPVITYTPCETFLRGRPFVTYARFEDASPLFEPKLVYRLTGETTWRSAAFKSLDNGLWRASIPTRELTGAFEYFVEAFDENGNGPARTGSPEEPMFARAVRKAPECAPPSATPVVVAAPIEAVGSVDGPLQQTMLTPPPASQEHSRCHDSDPPIYCKTWFWVAAGSVALATIGITAYAIGHGNDDRGYPDRVTFVAPAALTAGSR